MQKLPWKTMVMLYKSCSVFHEESNKIGFAFFWFFYDVLQKLQDPTKLLYYLTNYFTCRPLELFKGSQIWPQFTLTTLERNQSLQLGHWPWPPAATAKSRQAGVAGGQGRGGGGAWAHLGARGCRSSSGGVADDGARWRRSAVAAGGRNFGEAAMSGNAR
jgi:hypothetical protein